MQILIAEDDAVTLKTVAHALKRFGYGVTCAADGKSALEIFLQSTPQVVVTDWEMPGLDGPELCRCIRNAKLPSYTYIILLTARNARRELLEGLSAGADEFLSKPFDPEELRVRLRSAERVLRLEEDLRSANAKLRAMNEQLQKTSRIDPLMEIGNRLAFEEEFSRFHERAMSGTEEYGIVMCDIDHFKKCNDRYGHLQGDEILRQVAKTIRWLLRSGDAAFRFGGEEVLLLLQAQGLEGATAAAERVRHEIQKRRFGIEPVHQMIQVTMSCGVASYPANYDPAAGWSSLVKAADEALYEAKNAGRNRVVAARPFDRGLKQLEALAVS